MQRSLEAGSYSIFFVSKFARWWTTRRESFGSQWTSLLSLFHRQNENLHFLCGVENVEILLSLEQNPAIFEVWFSQSVVGLVCILGFCAQAARKEGLGRKKTGRRSQESNSSTRTIQTMISVCLFFFLQLLNRFGPIEGMTLYEPDTLRFSITPRYVRKPLFLALQSHGV